jgi:antitoxin (DNA-binding transcriptional repressor) of toxin-antitoxin stability system
MPPWRNTPARYGWRESSTGEIDAKNIQELSCHDRRSACDREAPGQEANADNPEPARNPSASALQQGLIDQKGFAFQRKLPRLGQPVFRSNSMLAVNMHEARTSLSRLVTAIEDGRESEIIIARGGHPVARLLPVSSTPKKRIGIAEGKFTVPDDIDSQNAEIARRFYGED